MLWVSWIPSLQGGPVAGGDTCVPNSADACVPAGRLCWDLASYFLWPFGKVIQKVEVTVRPKFGPHLGINWGVPLPHPNMPPHVSQVPKSHQVLGTSESGGDASGAGESSALLGGPVPRRWRPRCCTNTGYWVSPMLATVSPSPSPGTGTPVVVGMAPTGASAPPRWVFWGGQTLKVSTHWQRHAGTAAWLCLGYPVLALAHGLACVTAWLLVVLIPVAKLSARAVTRVLLLPPERVLVRRLRMVGVSGGG